MSLGIFNVAAVQRSAFVPLDGRPVENASSQWVHVDNTPYGKTAEHLVATR
jgi:hypothetical protein